MTTKRFGDSSEAEKLAAANRRRRQGNNGDGEGEDHGGPGATGSQRWARPPGTGREGERQAGASAEDKPRWRRPSLEAEPPAAPSNVRKTYWYPAATAAQFAAVVEDLHFATRLDKSVVMDELIKAAIKAQPQVLRALARRGGRVPAVPAPMRVPSLAEPEQSEEGSQREEGSQH